MGIKNIVAAIGETHYCINTMKYAIYLARQFGAKVTGIYVVDERILRELLKVRVFIQKEADEIEKEAEEQGHRFLERFKKMATSRKVEFESFLLKGEVHEKIVRKCREIGADLIVMGRLKEFVSRADLFYDDGERILREANCPVLVVRNPEKVEELYNELEKG